MTIKEILRQGIEILTKKKIKSASLDAEILLLFILSKFKKKSNPFSNNRIWLIAHNDYSLSKKQEIIFTKLIRRRALYEPIAYIVGKKEFYSLEFYVNKNTLIPRPETEIMVENALKDINFKLNDQLKNPPQSKIVIADIGTGSGAIAISIAKTLKDQGKIKNTIIYATDISAPTLKHAKKNAKNNNCDKNIIFKKGNLLKALPKNIKIDFLLANLPYVNKKRAYKIQKNKPISSYFLGLKYEPAISIFATRNGMIHFENFLKTATNHLSKKSKIYLESDPHQISKIKKLAGVYLPKNKITAIKDLRGMQRITKIEMI